MVPEYTKVSVFQISEKSAFKKVEKKAEAGIQTVTVKLLAQQQSMVFSAKVLAVVHESHHPKGVALVVKAQEATKGILKKEDPDPRAKKRVRFSEGES